MAGFKGMGKPKDVAKEEDFNIDDLFASVPDGPLPALASAKDPMMEKLEAMSAPAGNPEDFNIDDLFAEQGGEPQPESAPQESSGIVDKILKGLDVVDAYNPFGAPLRGMVDAATSDKSVVTEGLRPLLTASGKDTSQYSEIIERLAPKTATPAFAPILPGGIDPSDVLNEDELKQLVDAAPKVSSAAGLGADIITGAAGAKLLSRIISPLSRMGKAANTPALTDKIKNQVLEMKQVSDEIQAQGLNKIPFFAHNAVDADPTYAFYIQSISSLPEYQEAAVKTANAAEEVVSSILGSVANLSATADGLAPRFQKAAKSIRTGEGAALGEMRKAALSEAGDSTLRNQNLKNTLKATDSFFRKPDDFGMGFSMNEAGDIIPPAMEDAISAGVVKSPDEYLLYYGPQSPFRKAVTAMNNPGGVDYRTLRTNLGLLDEKYDKYAKTSDPGSFFKLRAALRNDEVDTLEVLFKGTPNEGKYASQLEKTRSIIEASNELPTFLESTASSDAFLVNLFSKGKREQVAAAKTILIENDPNLWKDMVGARFSGMIKKRSKDAANGFSTDWTGVAKDIEAMGVDNVSILFDGSQYDKKLLLDVLDFAGKVERTSPNFGEKTGILAKFVGMVGSAIQGNTKQVSAAAADLITRLGSTSKMRDALSNAPIDRILASTPKGKKEVMLQALEQAKRNWDAMDKLGPDAQSVFYTGRKSSSVLNKARALSVESKDDIPRR